MEIDWERLEALAAAELEATLSELPRPLRERAKALPVTMQTAPNPEQVRDGIEPDTLGLFVGPEYAYEETSTVPLPPQVILFLENLWAHSDENEEIFGEEVRTTYLHELGHYLGLDEDDLFDRGLE